MDTGRYLLWLDLFDIKACMWILVRWVCVWNRDCRRVVDIRCIDKMVTKFLCGLAMVEVYARERL